MDDNNIIDAEKSFEIQKLKDENKKLRNEITKLKILIKDLDPDADVSEISDQEAIAVEQLKKIKEYSSKRDLTTDEIKAYDVLVKNLRLIRGENSRSASDKNTKGLSKKDLEAIAKGK
jgi:hypothetical protein